METIEKISEETKENLGEFCIKECRAYCCRKGYMIVTPDEARLLAGENFDKLIEDKTLRELSSGKFILQFHNNLGGCPSLDLKDCTCKIHKNPGRPSTCRDFPIFIVGREIKISPRCPAKKAGKFFKFEHEAINLGYKIVDDFFGTD